MRRLLIASVLLLTAVVVPVPRLRGQAAPTDQKAPAFEVASVKANTSGDSRGGGRLLPGGRITFTNESLRSVTRDAYRQNDVLGGPTWVDTDKWDIAATAPSGQAEPPTQLMMQTLLAERFKLVVRLEQREQPVYALVLASSDRRLGPRIHTSVKDCSVTGNTCGTQSTLARSPGSRQNLPI